MFKKGNISKKEDNFFFFFCFSFQTRKNLALVKFYVVFLKMTPFLWVTLILHPGHTSLFLEAVRIKFMGPRGRGPRKTNTRFILLGIYTGKELQRVY